MTFLQKETPGMLTANRAAPEQIITPEMLMVLAPHTLFEASFYTETSPLTYTSISDSSYAV